MRPRRCTDERKSVEGILEIVRNCDVYADKGFIGQDWQQQIASSTGNCIWTSGANAPSRLAAVCTHSRAARQNQHHQNSSNLKRLISRVRQRIEGVFHEIQNTGRNPERLLNKTVQGLATQQHVCADRRLTTTGNAFALRTAKIASHTLRLLLRDRFSIDVLTFEFVTSS